jgi:hypothetical protein
MIHRTPSVGALINRILEINPALGVDEIIRIIKACVTIRGGKLAEFGSTERVDEGKALAMARATVLNRAHADDVARDHAAESR